MQSSNINTPLLITGATGYLASHIIQILLQEGYKVRGTVRSLAKKDKNQFLYDLVPEKKDNLELVEADLTNKDSWPKVLEGVEYVFHVASPIYPSVPKDEMEIIRPAVDGTLNVLEAAVKAGAKKVVVTSSCLAIFVGNAGRVLTEDDWSKEEVIKGYPKSKLLAEKAAWEFYEKNKDKIEMTVINPALILGPEFTKQGNASEGLVSEIIKGNFPGVMDVNMVLVDVRDAAKAHVNGMFKPNTNGKRYIVSSGTYPLGDVIKIAKEEFGKLGYNIKDDPVTAEEVKASGVEIAQNYLHLIGVKMMLNNDRAKQELDQTYHSLKEMIVDMGHSLIKSGVVPRPK